MMREVWRDIPGFEGHYQASDMGRVRSLRRKDSAGRIRSGRVLKPNRTSNGYLQVALCGPWGRISKLTHNLVCLAFYGKEQNLEVDHLDEDKENNCLYNLEYVTRQENVSRHHSRGRNLYIRFCPSKYPKRPYQTIIKGRYIGSFKTKEEALTARDEVLAR
jgi:hypothetical protein